MKKDWKVTLSYDVKHEDTYLIQNETKEDAIYIAENQNNSPNHDCILIKEDESDIEDEETTIKEVVFIVKDSLVKHPLFGTVMRSRHPIIVSRSNSREDFKIVMDRGQELLATGTSIMIFPQSSRAVEFKPEEFNSLGVKLAGRSGVQIVPIAIKTDFWGNGKYLKDLGPINRHKPIYMSFGKPLPVNGTGKEENKKIIEFITSNLIKWGGDIA